MDAFDRIIADHGAMIRRMASSRERDPALVDDLMQDILLAVWRALPGFRGDGSQKAFVARIAHNVSVSHVRRASRFRSAPLDDSLPSTAENPESDTDAALKRERLLEAVRSLPDSLREPLVLHLEGLTQSEIANALGLTATNAGVRLTRARAKLKEALS